MVDDRQHHRLPKRDHKVLIDEIKKVCFVGAGTMGCYNSLLAGIAGYETVVFDLSEEALAKVSDGQKQLGDYLVAIGTFNEAQVTKGRNQIHLETIAEDAVKDADLLSESVFEQLDLKRQVHRQFDELCPPQTILTTNTSTFMVSTIEDTVKRGEHFAAMHFHLGSSLVDVVAGPRTSPTTLDVVTRFVRSLECVPFIPAKENRGYVFNNLSTGLNLTAAALIVGYKECFEDIDRAWMASHKAPIGPFGIMDLVGLNVAYDSVQDHLRFEGENSSFRLIGDLLQPFINRGELGIKTGKGFYAYPEAAYGKPEFLTAVQPRQDIYRALVNGIIIRAVQLAEDGVANTVDIDKVWMITTKLDSGPFGWLDQKGIDIFLAEIESEKRYLLYADCDLDQVRKFLDPFIKMGNTGTSVGKGFYSYPRPTYRETAFLIDPFQEQKRI